MSPAPTDADHVWNDEWFVSYAFLWKKQARIPWLSSRRNSLESLQLFHKNTHIEAGVSNTESPAYFYGKSSGNGVPMPAGLENDAETNNEGVASSPVPSSFS